MERVLTLVEKLKQQLEQKASVDELLVTAQMLHAELLYAKRKDEDNVVVNDNPEVKSAVSVMVPFVPVLIPASQNGSLVGKAADLEVEEKVELKEKPEEKVFEVLQVDEEAIEEELAEIKRNAEAKNQMSAHARPTIMFDNEDEVPTLSHQSPAKEVSKSSNPPIPQSSHPHHESLNDKLKQTKIELGETLTEAPIRDLRKAIGVNDRFLFINELFRGDEAMYERSIKTINNFSILPEAQYWIQRELKVKIGWKDSDEVVKQFDQLVKRRFT